MLFIEFRVCKWERLGPIEELTLQAARAPDSALVTIDQSALLLWMIAHVAVSNEGNQVRTKLKGKWSQYSLHDINVDPISTRLVNGSNLQTHNSTNPSAEILWLPSSSTVRLKFHTSTIDRSEEESSPNPDLAVAFTSHLEIAFLNTANCRPKG